MPTGCMVYVGVRQQQYKLFSPNYSKLGKVPDENSDGAGSGSNIGSELNHARLCLQLQRSVKKLNSGYRHRMGEHAVVCVATPALSPAVASRSQRPDGVACREQSVMLHMLAVAMTACHVDAKFDRAPSNICAIWFLCMMG